MKKKALILKTTQPPRALSDLKAAKLNPREITAQNLNRLKSSLESFGDISGIVFNQRTGELISGHQRVFALTDSWGDLTIDPVSEAQGVIHAPNGETFSVRIVDWSEDDQLAASIAANSPTLQGTFSNEIGQALSELHGVLPDVYDLLGFAELKPYSIPEPEEWKSSNGDSEPQPLDERESEARAGRVVTEEIAKDVVLEARFEFKVPDKIAHKATKRLAQLAGELRGASVRRMD
jgi:hypothetical protein